MIRAAIFIGLTAIGSAAAEQPLPDSCKSLIGVWTSSKIDLVPPPPDLEVSRGFSVLYVTASSFELQRIRLVPDEEPRLGYYSFDGSQVACTGGADGQITVALTSNVTEHWYNKGVLHFTRTGDKTLQEDLSIYSEDGTTVVGHDVYDYTVSYGGPYQP